MNDPLEEAPPEKGALSGPLADTARPCDPLEVAPVENDALGVDVAGPPLNGPLADAAAPKGALGGSAALSGPAAGCEPSSTPGLKWFPLSAGEI